MANYRVCKQLSTSDSAYIAGLIDGEGTITLTRKHKDDNRQLSVSISSTEVQLLEFVLQNSGVGKITTKKTYKEHHLQSYTYAVYNRQALALLEQISPWLLSYKSLRAKLVLSKYVELTPRNGKYTPELRAARNEFERHFLSINSSNA